MATDDHAGSDDAIDPHVEDKNRRNSGESDDLFGFDDRDLAKIIVQEGNGSTVLVFASEANGVFQHSLSVAADSVTM